MHSGPTDHQSCLVGPICLGRFPLRQAKPFNAGEGLCMCSNRAVLDVPVILFSAGIFNVLDIARETCVTDR
jgi:hypothetical protein